MWGVTKIALNSTLGTPDFKPLDKILTNKRIIPSDEVLLNILTGVKNFAAETKLVFTVFTSPYNGTFKIKGEMWTKRDAEDKIQVLVNGAEKASFIGTSAGIWQEFEQNIRIERGDKVIVMFTKTSATDAELRNIAIYASIIDDIGIADNQEPIRYVNDGTEYRCTGVEDKNNIVEAYILDEIDGIPVTVVQGFAGGENLKKVRLGENIKSISLGCFSFTPIEEITIPASVNYIMGSSFDYCSNLRVVTFKGTPSGTIRNDVFENCPNLKDVYVPWSDGEVENAPWGAENATIHYNSEV